MFQLTQQQIDTFQRHANKQARKRLLESLIAEGVAASEQPGSDDIYILDGKGAKSAIRYRADGLIAEAVRPSGKATRFDYDRSSFLRSIAYPGGIRHEFVRNSLGQVESFSISGKSKYSFSYRTDQRISKIQFPDSREVGFDWSEDGSLQTLTDRCGNKNHHEQTPTGETVTDALGRKRVYQTDQEGKLSALLYPDGTREEYAFDQESNVVEVIQRNGSRVLLQLDDQGAPSLISWQDRNELELKFDDQDRLIAAKTGDFQVNRVYTKSGQVALEETTAGPVEYQFDPNGRVVSYTTPFGDKVHYEYDEDGLLKGILDWDKRRISIDYAENDTPCRFAFPSGVTEEQCISAAPFRASSRLQARSGVISEHAVEADECDRVRRVIDRWGSERADCLERRLEYDQEDRLVAEYNASDRRPLANFVYDAVGNMIQDNGQSIEFASMNQPLNRGDQSIDYDSLGNAARLTTHLGRVEATYTEDNRLRVLRANGQEYRYEYDGLCRRIRKTNGKETWEYGWSGSQLLWEEYYPAPKAESIRRDYLYLPNAATPIAFREHGKTYWIQSDFRGAVIAVHDEAGTIVWRGVYESFGACKTPINQVRQSWRLAGQYLDEESGLHYNLARYYCPKSKTYLSLDPRWQEPEATNYSYARNDPWNRADPLGMLAPLAIAAIGIGAAGIIGGAINAYQAPPGERASAFGKGFLVGAGAATAGVLAALALPKIGIAATAVAGLAIIGAVEGVAGAIISDIVAGNPICVECALLSAGIGAVLGVALPLVGGFLARKLLTPIMTKIAQSKAAKDAIAKVAKHSGFSARVAKAIQKVADKHNVKIQMRPTNQAAQEMLEAGTHLPKPSAVKMKTINKLDLELGAAGKEGEAALFKPKKPPKNASKELKKRYKQRQIEWHSHRNGFIAKGKHPDFEIDSNGVIRKKREPGKGKAFVGDNDIYSITDAKTGKPIPADDPRHKNVMSDMKKKPINAQHGDVVSWDTKGSKKDAADKKKLINTGKTEKMATFEPGESPSVKTAKESQQGL
jgi:RHS repeat-associated protein